MILWVDAQLSPGLTKNLSLSGCGNCAPTRVNTWFAVENSPGVTGGHARCYGASYRSD